MITIERVLAPIDLSEASQRSLDCAVAVSSWFKAGLTVLHVRNPPVNPLPPLAFAQGGAENTVDPMGPRAVEEQIGAWLAPARAAGVEATVIIDSGTPADRILAVASSLASDLIVLGTHIHGFFERLVLGSATEAVVRGATCPVMAVPPDVAGGLRLPFTHVLCAIDFSDPSVAALEYALVLAQQLNARLTLLHTYEWPAEEGAPVPTAAFHQKLESEGARRLDAMIPDSARVWCTPAIRVVFGTAADEILHVAEADGADLIVMGVHGRSALSLLLLGSTARGVMTRASCPVLTIRRG